MIVMHAGLKYATADEVAECFDGVEYDGELYRALWASLDPNGSPQTDRDDIRDNDWFAGLSDHLKIEANEASRAHWRE